MASIYMRVSGLQVEGAATIGQLETAEGKNNGWFAINSYSWGGVRNVAMDIGNGTNADSGMVEYLQLPVSMLRKSGKSDRFIWNESDLETKPVKSFNVPTETSYWTFKTNLVTNARGFKLMGDIRSQGNGWGHVAAPIPTAIGDNLYIPIMNGMVYVIDWNAKIFDENAILSINDLGPLGDVFTRGNITYSNGKLFAQTIQEIICIQ